MFSRRFLLTLLLALAFSALAVDFLLSLWVGAGSLYGESYHVIIFLEADPSYVLRAIAVVVLMGILPIAASLALHVAIYVKGGYARLSRLSIVLILGVGGLVAAWGYVLCRASYDTYFFAVSSTHNGPVVGLDGHLLQIYSVYGVYGAIWLLLGMFLMGASLLSLSKQKGTRDTLSRPTAHAAAPSMP